MKIVKKIAVVFLVVVIVLPILAYAAIVITNNYLADTIEKELVNYSMPSNTELIDSISITGKLIGNGNGMQYMGSILVKSDLSCDELIEYYSNDFYFIEVREQKTASIDFIGPRNYSFNAKLEEDETYYSITCWDIDTTEYFGQFIIKLLDFDIRGH